MTVCSVTCAGHAKLSHGQSSQTVTCAGHAKLSYAPVKPNCHLRRSRQTVKCAGHAKQSYAPVTPNTPNCLMRRSRQTVTYASHANVWIWPCGDGAKFFSHRILTSGQIHSLALEADWLHSVLAARLARGSGSILCWQLA